MKPTGKKDRQLNAALSDEMHRNLHLIEMKLGMPRAELVRRLLDGAVKHFERTGSLPLEGFGYPADIAESNVAAVGEAAAPYGITRMPTAAEMEAMVTNCMRDILPRVLKKNNLQIMPAPKAKSYKSAAAKAPRRAGAAAPLSRSRPPAADGGTAALGT